MKESTSFCFIPINTVNKLEIIIIILFSEHQLTRILQVSVSADFVILMWYIVKLVLLNRKSIILAISNWFIIVEFAYTIDIVHLLLFVLLQMVSFSF